MFSQSEYEHFLEINNNKCINDVNISTILSLKQKNFIMNIIRFQIGSLFILKKNILYNMCYIFNKDMDEYDNNGNKNVDTILFRIYIFVDDNYIIKKSMYYNSRVSFNNVISYSIFGSNDEHFNTDFISINMIDKKFIIDICLNSPFIEFNSPFIESDNEIYKYNNVGELNGNIIKLNQLFENINDYENNDVITNIIIFYKFWENNGDKMFGISLFSDCESDEYNKMLITNAIIKECTEHNNILFQFID